MEDLADEFVTEHLSCKIMAENSVASSSRVKKIIADRFTRLTPSTVKFDADTNSQIKPINCRLDELCKQRVSLGLQKILGGTSTAAAQKQIPRTTCVPTEPVVYGRENDRAKILHMVLRVAEPTDDSNFHMIPIVGMEGIGKTTLARPIELVARKFLLVLEDVWSKDYGLWEALKSPFMAGAPRSKIIISTRLGDVTSTMGTTDCYNIELLPEDSCICKYINFFSQHKPFWHKIKTLLESTRSLFNLQFFILVECLCLMKLPSNMRNLINLYYLDISDANLIGEMPLGMKELKILRKLSNFIVGKECNRFKRRKSREWGSQFDHSRNEAVEENVLDMLQPQRNLKELTIKCYSGRIFPSWIGHPSFNKMVLPSLGQLRSLKDLTIIGMTGIKSIGSEMHGEINSVLSFQSLESLSFDDFPEWEHWELANENEHKCEHLKSIHQGLRNLSHLQEIHIDNCTSFVSFPQGGLPITNLKVLYIHCCEKLNALPNFMHSLMSLKELSGFQNLTSLKYLTIQDCPNLSAFPEVGLPSSLLDINIDYCPRLKKHCK
ncbi:NB-ARC domain containing protein expressed [Citrus sinensis]|nr:NB-ARC domain containing protein expressed [Citrus sinensis]